MPSASSHVLAYSRQSCPSSYVSPVIGPARYTLGLPVLFLLTRYLLVRGFASFGCDASRGRWTSGRRPPTTAHARGCVRHGRTFWTAASSGCRGAAEALRAAPGRASPVPKIRGQSAAASAWEHSRNQLL